LKGEFMWRLGRVLGPRCRVQQPETQISDSRVVLYDMQGITSSMCGVRRGLPANSENAKS